MKITVGMVLAYTAGLTKEQAEQVAAAANANGWCVWHAMAQTFNTNKCWCADCMPGARFAG